MFLLTETEYTLLSRLTEAPCKGLKEASVWFELCYTGNPSDVSRYNSNENTCCEFLLVVFAAVEAKKACLGYLVTLCVETRCSTGHSLVGRPARQMQTLTSD